MRAVVFDKPGGPEVLRLSQVRHPRTSSPGAKLITNYALERRYVCCRAQDEPKPDLKPKDVRIRTLTAAINRAEAFQRQGTYPAPPGASKLLGLECCGIITEVRGRQRLGMA